MTRLIKCSSPADDRARAGGQSDVELLEDYDYSTTQHSLMSNSSGDLARLIDQATHHADLCDALAARYYRLALRHRRIRSTLEAIAAAGGVL